MDEKLTYLGRTNWRDMRRPFGILERDRAAHMYVVGKTGAGKSTLLETMMRQDLLDGNGFAVFDPHGDLVERLHAWAPEQLRDKVLYLDVPNPSLDFGFNPLENVPPLRRSVVANGIVEALKKIFADSWGVRLEFILRTALLVLLDQEEATIADVLRLLHEPEFRRKAAARATNPHVRRFWAEQFESYPARFRTEAVSPVENKLGSFLVDPFVSRILTERKSTFDPRAVMDEGKAVLVNLAKGKIGEAPAMLFGSLLVSAFGMAGLGRADSAAADRRPFYLYLDEFQTMTTLALANMLAELRKYGVGLTLANQFLEQVAPEIRTAILGNVGTMIVFRLGAADAGKIAKELGPTIDPVDLTFLPNWSFWIRPLVRGEAVEAFTGTTIRLRSRDAAMEG